MNYKNALKEAREMSIQKRSTACVIVQEWPIDFSAILEDDVKPYNKVMARFYPWGKWVEHQTTDIRRLSNDPLPDGFIGKIIDRTEECEISYLYGPIENS